MTQRVQHTELTVSSATFLLIVLATAPVRAADSLPNTLSATEKDAGFQLLFDGRSLDGWKQSGNWQVVDGAIEYAGKGGGIEYTRIPIPDDFELRFEWKVAKGSNSGVYYRPGQYEYQILDNKVHRDGKNPRTSAASLYFCIAPSHDATRDVGQWNSGRVVCKGSVIQHWLNGKKVIDFDYTDKRYATNVERLGLRGADLKSRGRNLMLQDHGDPVWYRSIRLRTLEADDELERSEVTPQPVPEAAVEYEQQVIERLQNRRKTKS